MIPPIAHTNNRLSFLIRSVMMTDADVFTHRRLESLTIPKFSRNGLVEGKLAPPLKKMLEQTMNYLSGLNGRFLTACNLAYPKKARSNRCNPAAGDEQPLACRKSLPI